MKMRKIEGRPMTAQTKRRRHSRSDKPLITDTQSALDLMATVKYESGCDLGDSRKTAPKKLRTVIQYPIRRA
jgi:hypothetical protein